MLTRIKINGFKNLRDIDLRLGLFNCVAGSNGVGKSNLFDAICFLADLASMPIVAAAIKVRGANGQLNDIKNLFSIDADGKAMPMEFTVECIVPRQVQDDFDRPGTPTATYLEYSLELRLVQENESTHSRDPLYIHKESLKAKRKKDAEQELGFTESMEFINQFIIDPRKRNSPFIETIDDGDIKIIKLWGEGGKAGALPKIPAKKSPQTVLCGVTAISHPTGLALKREMQSWKLLQLEPTALRKPDEFGSDTTVTANGEHLPAALQRIGLFADVAASLSELIPGIDSVEVDSNEIRKLRTLCVKLQGHKFSAGALSDGTLRFLALAVMAADPDASGVICMEEPENGIHPMRIPQMVELVRQLSDVESLANNDWGNIVNLRQVIINTHSPLIVAELNPDELIMAVPYYKNVMQWVRFKTIHESWRTKYPDKKDAVTKGQVIAYLPEDLLASALWQSTALPAVPGSPRLASRKLPQTHAPCCTSPHRP